MSTTAESYRFAASRISLLAWVLALLVFLAGLGLVRAEDAPVTPEQERFFEEKIRPVLVSHCWECHAEKKQESGLRLDSREAVLKGGISNERAVVLGEAENSLLWKAVNHIGDTKMPPDNKLPDDQIANIKQWINMGLPWPKSAGAAPAVLGMSERVDAARKTHWSLQPVASPVVPDMAEQAGWSRNAVDAFVAQKHKGAGIAPSPEADPRTLLRRVTLDLTGLAPTFEEMEAFAADTAPDAFERAVDRLLASPRYGERWGRHWLDVARYADTKGYTFGEADRRYPYSYTYRDWVITALNSDISFENFVKYQLAADQLPVGPQRDELAAMGFLTTGRKFNNFHDDMDDQIDVVTRGFLGLTVTCARCHDHKYDPIPAEDYYSLFGVFASSREPGELPLIGNPQQTAEYQAYEAELKKRRDAVAKFDVDKRLELIERYRQQVADYLARSLASEPELAILATLNFISTSPHDLNRKVVERWQKYLAERAKVESALWCVWSQLTPLPAGDFPAKSNELVAKLLERPEGLEAGQIHPKLKAALMADPIQAKFDVPRLYGKLIKEAYTAWQSAGANEEVLAKMEPSDRMLAEVLVAANSPTDLPTADIVSFFNREVRDMRKRVEVEIDRWVATSPAAPPRAMVMEDKPDLFAPKVLLRGNPGRPGKDVPRQFLVSVVGNDRQPFKKGSGRLELAEALVAPTNPLTRRVMVNRIWQQHFGMGLVVSASDFGVRSSPPTHPELLDFLADSLLKQGGSMKEIHRLLVTSATYRQSSAERADARAIDPENRLLWKMNVRRLELEPMRDNLLAAADQLDMRMGGQPVMLTGPNYSHRRAVYAYLDRQDLPGFYRVFDLASPDQSTALRPNTSVPQQALFFLNSAITVDQAKKLLGRAEVVSAASDDDKISALYRVVFGRNPTDEEKTLGREYVQSLADREGEKIKLNPWQQYCQLLLGTNEFLFVD